MLFNANKGHGFIDFTYDCVLFVALLFVSVLFPSALGLCLSDSKAVITERTFILFCLSRTLSLAEHPELLLTKLLYTAVESPNYHGYNKY